MSPIAINILMGLYVICLIAMWFFTLLGTNVYIEQEEKYIKGSDLIIYYIVTGLGTYVFLKITEFI